MHMFKGLFNHLFLKVKQQQSEIFQFLDSKKMKYFAVDISQNQEKKDEMRKKAGNPSAMPPQVFNGDKYCGVSVIHTLSELVYMSILPAVDMSTSRDLY